MSTPAPVQPNQAGATPSPDSVPMLIQLTPTPKLPLLSGLWVGAAVPPSLREYASQFNLQPAKSIETAAEILDISLETSEPSSTWIYALVAAFPTVQDGLTFTEIELLWQGKGKFYLTESTLAAMKPVLGEPGAGVVRIIPAEGLTDSLWQDRPALALIPFEDFNPKLKVLEIDSQSPLRKDFNAETYPLRQTFNVQHSTFLLPKMNRDPEKLTTVILTGTTALVRAIAFKMEEKGMDFPAQQIGDTLREADILHISNEVAFVDGCPTPEMFSERMVFCSDPRYVALFEAVGVDVIELTGNHVNDWGAKWLGKSVAMINERGWGHYGGGANLADAQTPFRTVVNGNKIAFIGCNMAGPSGAWATESQPGAAPCGDYARVKADIAAAHADGYLPVVTVQFSEYYQDGPSDLQARDFGRLAEAGAAVVLGSQSHFPQSFAFEDGAFIHYGPGNLFFDQMFIDDDKGVRRAFMDRLVIYDNRLIGIELLTTRLEDYSLRRWMTTEEREKFLEEYFEASGW